MVSGPCVKGYAGYSVVDIKSTVEEAKHKCVKCCNLVSKCVLFAAISWWHVEARGSGMGRL